jgi:hypothetical protein
MTDPERLFHGTESELARSLLSAAREEMPDERLLSRTLLAVGTGAAVLGAAGAAGGAGAGTSSLSALAAKWFGIVEHALAPKVEVPERAFVVAASPPVEVAPSVVAPRVETAPPSEPTPTAKLPAAPAPSAPRLETKEGEPSIALELVAIDRARAALGRGDDARALALVSESERQPGPKRMAQEALAIRMEAEARSGDLARARASAERFLAQSPNGPQAARARQILGR